MKITCERCRAQYDIEDKKVPASGFKMTCPACSHEMTVTAPGAASASASAGPREIALSSMEDEADLPAPKAASARPPTFPGATISPAPKAPPITPPAPTAPPAIATLGEAALSDDVDFSSLAPASAPAALDVPLDLDAPDEDEPDLPAAVVRIPAQSAPIKLSGAPEEADLPAAKSRKAPSLPTADAGVDLPAPKARPPVPTAAARPPVPGMPPRVPAHGAPPPLPTNEQGVQPKVDLMQPIIDVPQPKRTDAPGARGGLDLPQPKIAAAKAASVGDEAGDFSLPLDLDAPDVDEHLDLNAEVAEPPAARSDAADLPTPRVSDPPAEREADGVASLADLLEGEQPKKATALSSSRGQAFMPPDEEKRPGKRKKVLFFAAGGVALIAVAGGVAVAVGVVGGGGPNKREVEVKLVSARRALGDDTLASYRRAASDLKPFTSGEKPSVDASALEAQAHFLAGRLGIPSEVVAGKALVDRPVEGAPSADQERAQALSALASGDVANARKQLKGLLEKTPLDATALTYLGWTELTARDPATAAALFTRALSAEPTRAQAAYGLGLSKERLGDDKAAKEAYTKVLATVADHVRARLGLLRIDARSGDPAAAGKIEALIAERSTTMSPRESAEGQIAMGQIALDIGRADDAEERFKKAAALDADPAASHVAFDAKLGLARARVLGDRPGDAIEDLRKLVALDTRGVEARLLLAQALIDKQEQQEAETFLVAVDALQPKDARLALLRARLLLSRASVSKDDREAAVVKLREATAADAKLLPAWATLGRTLHDLGRTGEALEALDKAAALLSGDPRGAALIGAAYLAIGKPAEAEARFRAVLDAEAKKARPSVESVPLWLGLGEALEAQGKLDAAQTTYGDAQKIAPSSAPLLERRARLAARRGQAEEARKLFDEALKIGVPTASLRLAAAQLALEGGRGPDARALADSVLKEDERSALANLILARAAIDAGNPEEAVGLARRAVTLQDMPEAHLVLAQVLEQTNKLEGASAEYSLARRPPTRERATLGRARILVRMGATRDALAEIGPLTKSGNLRAEALVIEGDCYSDMQQGDKARHSYEEASKISPPSADALFKLGRAQLDAGKRRPAVDALDRAVKLATQQTSWIAEAYQLLGDAHRAGKEDAQAIAAYQKFLTLAPPDSAARAEIVRNIQLLGGTPPTP